MATAVGPRALLTAIAAGAAAVLALWWHSTLSLTGFGGWLTGAGEILGLLAGYAVVVLAALMARIRPIERGIGADRLARWHAMGGRYVIGLISGHALAIIWGYAVTAQTSPVSETATLLTTYPDVLMATVAWFLLLGVGLVSARAVRRRMSYETRFLTRGLWWQSHPYSLSAVPSDELMRITVQGTGDHSAALARLAPGTRVLAEGPFGAFTPVRTNRSVLLLAGGVGITPLRAMFAALSGKVTLIYRASAWQDIVFQSELDAIAEARGATVHYVVGSRREFGGDPLSATALRQLAPGLHRMDVYLCGPPGMTGTAVAALTEAGVPRRRIHYESFEL